jgi:hypothetical protein
MTFLPCYTVPYPSHTVKSWREMRHVGTTDFPNIRQPISYRSRKFLAGFQLSLPLF